jgi:hypothetical protein
MVSVNSILTSSECDFKNSWNCSNVSTKSLTPKLHVMWHVTVSCSRFNSILSTMPRPFNSSFSAGRDKGLGFPPVLVCKCYRCSWTRFTMRLKKYHPSRCEILNLSLQIKHRLLANSE